MTRTGLAPFLMRHTPEPMVAIHPLDAAVRRIGQGALVRISTAEGDVLMRADLRRTQRPGEVFAPMHWTDQFASAGPIGRLVSAKVDPLSGQPELKATPVDVTPAVVHFHGLLLRRTGAALPASCHWVRVPVAGGQMYRLAGLHPMPHADDLARFAAGLLALPEGTGRLEASDQRRGVLRMAAVRDGALEACLFLARDAASLPNAAALIPMLGAPLPDAARSNLLAGRINRATAAGGAKVCACFGVARNAIRDAVARHRLASVHQIGALLRAGTNCGSCIPELEEILRDVHVSAG